MLGERPPQLALRRLLARAIYGLVRGEWPAIALLLYSCCASWDVDWLIPDERPVIVLPKLLLLGFWRLIAPTGRTTGSGSWSICSFFLQKASFFVFLCLDFCASSQITCTLTKLIKTHKTWGFYNNSIWKMWYISDYIAHSSIVSEVTPSIYLWSQMSIWIYNILSYVLGTHLEIQEAIKSVHAERKSL